MEAYDRLACQFHEEFLGAQLDRVSTTAECLVLWERARDADFPGLAARCLIKAFLFASGVEDYMLIIRKGPRRKDAQFFVHTEFILRQFKITVANELKKAIWDERIKAEKEKLASDLLNEKIIVLFRR